MKTCLLTSEVKAMTDEERKARRREYTRRYRAKHPEAVKKNNEKCREYYWKHRDEVLAYTKDYCQRHREERNAYYREYNKSRKEKNMEYYHEYYQKHHDEILKKAAEYRRKKKNEESN